MTLGLVNTLVLATPDSAKPRSALAPPITVTPLSGVCSTKVSLVMGDALYKPRGYFSEKALELVPAITLGDVTSGCANIL